MYVQFLVAKFKYVLEFSLGNLRMVYVYFLEVNKRHTQPLSKQNHTTFLWREHSKIRHFFLSYLSLAPTMTPSRTRSPRHQFITYGR